MQSPDTLTDLFRAHGRKITAQRQCIFRALEGDVTHPSAERVHEKVRREMPNVSLAVHYLRFAFTEAQVAAFRDAAEVALVATHPAYEARTVLPPAVRDELLGDLLGDLLGTTKPYLSADQGQFRAQVFTGAQDLSHTLRSPKFGDGATGRCIERASEQGECKYPPMYPL